MSIFPPRSGTTIMYSSMTMAIPETMAEKRKTTGIMTLLHQGLALTEPKMKPT